MFYKVVEKQNHKALHAICDDYQSAYRWLTINVPEYIKRGMFDDKTLTADSFTIIEVRNK